MSKLNTISLLNISNTANPFNLTTPPSPTDPYLATPLYSSSENGHEVDCNFGINLANLVLTPIAMAVGALAVKYITGLFNKYIMFVNDNVTATNRRLDQTDGRMALRLDSIESKLTPNTPLRPPLPPEDEFPSFYENRPSENKSPSSSSCLTDIKIIPPTPLPSPKTISCPPTPPLPFPEDEIAKRPPTPYPHSNKQSPLDIYQKIPDRPKPPDPPREHNIYFGLPLSEPPTEVSESCKKYVLDNPSKSEAKRDF